MFLTGRRVAYLSLVAAFLMLAATLWMAALSPAPDNTLKGSFTLTTQNGEIFTDNDFKGKQTLLFFGFTHCPDICPTKLVEITPYLDKYQVVFVTIDPERDTPEQIKLYLSSFDKRIIGLTGTIDQISKIIKIYRVYAKKIPDNKGSYTMDHTSTLYYINANGEFISSFNPKKPM